MAATSTALPWVDGVLGGLDINLGGWARTLLPGFSLGGAAGMGLGFILVPTELGDGTLQPGLIEAMRQEREIRNFHALVSAAQGGGGVLSWSLRNTKTETMPLGRSGFAVGVGPLGLFLLDDAKRQAPSYTSAISVRPSGSLPRTGPVQGTRNVMRNTVRVSQDLAAMLQRSEQIARLGAIAAESSMRSLQEQMGVIRQRYDDARAEQFRYALDAFKAGMARQKAEFLQEQMWATQRQIQAAQVAYAAAMAKLGEAEAEWGHEVELPDVSGFPPGTLERQLAKFKLVRAGQALEGAAAFNYWVDRSASARRAGDRLAGFKPFVGDTKAGYSAYRLGLRLINRSYGSLTEGFDFVKAMTAGLYVEDPETGQRHYIGRDLKSSAQASVGQGVQWRPAKVGRAYIRNLADAWSGLRNGTVKFDPLAALMAFAWDQSLDLAIGHLSSKGGESMRQLGIRSYSPFI